MASEIFHRHGHGERRPENGCEKNQAGWFQTVGCRPHRIGFDRCHQHFVDLHPRLIFHKL